MDNDIIYYSIKALHCQGGKGRMKKSIQAVGWYRTPYELLQDSNLTDKDIMLYGIMLDCCDTALFCSISQQDVTRMSYGRISQKTFYRCLERLERCGYIRRGDRTGRENAYTLTDIVGLKRQQKPIITQSRRSEPEPEKEAHGTYQRVLLTAEQYSQLVSDYGRDKVQEYIRRCDDYCQCTGKHYADYDAVLRKWISEDADAKEPTAERQLELDLYDALIN